MVNIDYMQIIETLWITLIKPFWWFWILLFGVPLAVPIARLYIGRWLDKRWFKKHKRLIEWKTIDPKKFERIVAIIFEGLGYKTKVVGGSGDEGIDIIAHRDGKRFFIQCKRKNQVPPKDVREFAGSIRDLNKEKGEKGFIVTTGEFTEEGKSFAKDNLIEIELINGFRLEKLVKEIEI